MTTIQYLEEEILIPEGWEDIKLRDYEGFYLDKPETLQDKVVLVAKICKADPALILKWPVEIFNLIVDKIFFVFEEPSVTPSPSIKIKGVTYTIPIEEKLSLGAYIDADEVQKEGTHILSNILAIVCRPAGEEYNPDKVFERAELFGNLSVAEVQPLLSFFLLCRDVSERRMKVFTNLCRAVQYLPPNTALLPSRGGGIRLFPMWRGIRYGVLMRLLHYRLQKFSRFCNTGGIKITPKGLNIN